MRSRSTALILLAACFMMLLAPNAAQAACPSPSTSFCNAKCDYTGWCVYDSNECKICTRVSDAGCASWIDCYCCSYGPMF